MIYSYDEILYLTVKMNELELNTLTWMNIVDIMRNKTKNFMIIHKYESIYINLKHVKVNNIFYKDKSYVKAIENFHGYSTPQIQNSVYLWRGGKEMKSGWVHKGL